jgi:murein L,D-transpeptidase YafK
VALGRRPEGPKRAEGDLRTPEGLYRISGAARASRFHRFLPFDYPSREDAERARAEGRITRAELARIEAALARGAPPPHDTPLGGHLGFHGEGARWRGDSEHLDWTYGCIAMTDERIEFLATRTLPGTPVRIEP